VGETPTIPEAGNSRSARGLALGCHARRVRRVVLVLLALALVPSTAAASWYRCAYDGVIVVFLIFLNTRSLIETGIVLLAVPFSLVGAIWLIYLLHYNVSVAVWIGMIALAGLDAETGVVMLLYLTLAHRARRAEGRIVEGAAHRIGPS
jgi:hypothetical protein